MNQFAEYRFCRECEKAVSLKESLLSETISDVKILSAETAKLILRESLAEVSSRLSAGVIDQLPLLSEFLHQTFQIAKIVPDQVWVLEQLSGIIDKANNLLSEAIIGFGRYEGKDTSEIPTKDLQWMYDNLLQMNQGTRNAIKTELSKRTAEPAKTTFGGSAASGRKAQIPAQPAKPATATPTVMGKTWYLAKALVTDPNYNLTKGQNIAISSRDAYSWEYVILDPSAAVLQGIIPANKVGALVKSQTDAQGNKVTGNSIEDIFKHMLESGSDIAAPASQTPTQQAPVEEPIEEPIDEPVEEPMTPGPAITAQGPPGRLTGNKINEFNTAITNSFLGNNDRLPQIQRPNMVIDALAGTGKTTVLKHLASYKKPNERWVYLVFNAKNAAEANAKDSPFKAMGVEAMTSHTFLGRLVLEPAAKARLLPKSEIIGDDEEEQEAKREKITELVEHNEWVENAAANQYRIQPVLRWPFKRTATQVAKLGRHYAVNPSDHDAGEQLVSIMEKYSIDTTLQEDLLYPLKFDKDRDYTDEIINVALELLEMCLPGKSPDPQFNTVRDHDDTLWWAATHADQIPWPKFDVVLADEVQDFNVCQLIMLQKLHDAGARIISVGDPNQALYMFRGADNDAFKNVQQMLGGLINGVKDHPLPVNYRCCKEIIDYVNKNTHVNNLVAGAKDKDGQLLRGVVTENFTYPKMLDLLNAEWQGGRKLAKETAILCRKNSPLLSCALALMKRGIDFEMVGRDLYNELKRFVDKVAKAHGQPVAQTSTGYSRFKSGKSQYASKKVVAIELLAGAISKYVETREDLWGRKANKQEQLKQNREVGQALQGVLQYLAENNFQDPLTGQELQTSDHFLSFLASKFGGMDPAAKVQDAKRYAAKDKKSFVMLSTGHRSKGLEFDRVFILRNDAYLIPAGKNAAEEQQEKNGKYVAYTRGKTELHLLNDKQPE